MKGKGGLALILGTPDKKEPAHEGGLGDSGDELADILGVPEEKRDSFKRALHGYVVQCASEDEPDDDDYGNDKEM